MIAPNRAADSIAAAPAIARARREVVRVLIVSLPGSLPVVAHKRGRAALVADHGHLPPCRGGDHGRRARPTGKSARGLVETPERPPCQRLCLRRTDGCAIK